MNINTDLKYTPGENGETHITILHGPFAKTVYKYGKVWFPDESEPVLSYDYDLISTPLKFDKKAFEQFAGEVIVEILRSQINDQSVIYKGGVDAA